MENNFDPITLSEAKWYAKRAREVPPQDARDMQRFMLQRLAEVGASSPEVPDIINGMLDHLKAEAKEMMRQLMMEQLRRDGMLGEEKIDADDDQIVQALKWTLPKFKSNFDWAGIYKILVPCCDFPESVSDFVRRMARMGIYPKDNKPENVVRSMPIAISDKDLCGHPFSYQAVQRGLINGDHSEISKIFKANLYRAISM